MRWSLGVDISAVRVEDCESAARDLKDWNPDFAGTAADRVRHGSVESDAGHEQRESAEAGAELGEDPLLTDRPIDSTRLRGYIRHRNLRSNVVNNLPDRIRQRRRIAGGAQFEDHPTKPACLRCLEPGRVGDGRTFEKL
jgi:hypothetical protein